MIVEGAFEALTPLYVLLILLDHLQPLPATMSEDTIGCQAQVRVRGHIDADYTILGEGAWRGTQLFIFIDINEAAANTSP